MRFFSYLIVAAISFAVAMYMGPSLSSQPTASQDFSDVSIVETETQDAVPYTSYYDQLNRFQQKLYDALLPAIRNGDESITFTNINMVEMKKYCFDFIFFSLYFFHTAVYTGSHVIECNC